jgi:GNAT superfamily N-acetyltransferase
LKIYIVTTVTSDLEALWHHAHRDVLAKRGGAALLETIQGASSESEFLDEVIATSSLWAAEVDGKIRGFGLIRDGVVEAIYVEHSSRRQKLATKLVRSALGGENPPVDAYALPGDRATKSLYESLGWKARLLTMRGV